MAVLKILLLCFGAASAKSQFLLKADPSDALANKLMKQVGFDSNEGEFGAVHVHGWKEVKIPDGSKDSSSSSTSHKRLSSKDLMGYRPEISAGGLPSPKAWSKSADNSQEASTLSSIKDGMNHMYNDLGNTQRSKPLSDWSEYASNAGAEELNSEASSPTKEVVKVFHQDTVIRQPVQKSASPVSDEDSSVPAAYLKKLRSGPSAGHRWFKQEKAEAVAQSYEDIPALRAMDANELAAKAEHMKELDSESEHDSLAASLASEFKMEKQKQHSQELKQQRPHLPTGEVKKQEVPETSALDSVHRSKDRLRKMLPIRPEDKHNQTDPAPSPALQLPVTMGEQKMPTVVPTKPLAPEFVNHQHEEQEKDSASGNLFDDLFSKHAVNGLVDDKGMETVLEKLGSINNFNWQRFDLDNDGKLSRKEFTGAVTVAQRFQKK